MQFILYGLGDALNGGQIFLPRETATSAASGALAVAHFSLPIGRFITSTSRSFFCEHFGLDRIKPGNKPHRFRIVLHLIFGNIQENLIQASFDRRKPGSRRSRPLVRSSVSEQVQIRMIRALVRLGRTGRRAAITGFGRVTVGLYLDIPPFCCRQYDMVRGEKCVPFTLPTSLLWPGATIISSLKPRPGAASFQRAPGLVSNALGQGGYKYPFPSGWISLSPGLCRRWRRPQLRCSWRRHSTGRPC